MSNQSNLQVIITGAGGMLGHDVAKELTHRNLKFNAFTRSQWDITSPDDARARLSELKRSTPPPEIVIINCAAYTDVNKAESDYENALRINGHGPHCLAKACEENGARLVHVSTDYVFNGQKTDPYETNDPVDPINAYGASKLAGETAIRENMSQSQWTIARTSWLYGLHGPNFVKTMLNLARQNRDLKVINDQIGAPTYTPDLAHALVDLALVPHGSGIVHITNTGTCSWYEFATQIFELSGIKPASLKPCASDEFPTPARRPANSRLSPASLRSAGIELLPHWTDGLRRYLAQTGELPGR